MQARTSARVDAQEREYRTRMAATLQMGHRAEQLREKTRAAQSCVELEVGVQLVAAAVPGAPGPTERMHLMCEYSGHCQHCGSTGVDDPLARACAECHGRLSRLARQSPAVGVPLTLLTSEPAAGARAHPKALSDTGGSGGGGGGGWLDQTVPGNQNDGGNGKQTKRRDVMKQELETLGDSNASSSKCCVVM